MSEITWAIRKEYIDKLVRIVCQLVSLPRNAKITSIAAGYEELVYKRSCSKDVYVAKMNAKIAELLSAPQSKIEVSSLFDVGNFVGGPSNVLHSVQQIPPGPRQAVAQPGSPQVNLRSYENQEWEQMQYNVDTNQYQYLSPQPGIQCNYPQYEIPKVPDVQYQVPQQKQTPPPAKPKVKQRRKTQSSPRTQPGTQQWMQQRSAAAKTRVQQVQEYDYMIPGQQNVEEHAQGSQNPVPTNDTKQLYIMQMRCMLSDAKRAVEILVEHNSLSYAKLALHIKLLLKKQLESANPMSSEFYPETFNNISGNLKALIRYCNGLKTNSSQQRQDLQEPEPLPQDGNVQKVSPIPTKCIPNIKQNQVQNPMHHQVMRPVAPNLIQKIEPQIYQRNQRSPVVVSRHSPSQPTMQQQAFRPHQDQGQQSTPVQFIPQYQESNLPQDTFMMMQRYQQSNQAPKQQLPISQHEPDSISLKEQQNIMQRQRYMMEQMQMAYYNQQKQALQPAATSPHHSQTQPGDQMTADQKSPFVHHRIVPQNAKIPATRGAQLRQSQPRGQFHQFQVISPRQEPVTMSPVGAVHAGNSQYYVQDPQPVQPQITQNWQQKAPANDSIQLGTPAPRTTWSPGKQPLGKSYPLQTQVDQQMQFYEQNQDQDSEQKFLPALGNAISYSLARMKDNRATFDKMPMEGHLDWAGDALNCFECDSGQKLWSDTSRGLNDSEDINLRTPAAHDYEQLCF